MPLKAPENLYVLAVPLPCLSIVLPGISWCRFLMPLACDDYKSPLSPPPNYFLIWKSRLEASDLQFIMYCNPHYHSRWFGYLKRLAIEVELEFCRGILAYLLARGLVFGIVFYLSVTWHKFISKFLKLKVARLHLRERQKMPVDYRHTDDDYRWVTNVEWFSR